MWGRNVDFSIYYYQIEFYKLAISTQIIDTGLLWLLLNGKLLTFEVFMTTNPNCANMNEKSGCKFMDVYVN